MASAPDSSQGPRFPFLRSTRRSLALVGALWVGLAAHGFAGRAAVGAVGGEPPLEATGESALPRRLSQTGLYHAGNTSELDPRVLVYTPQYPLWSDGASKRRYVRLPEGMAVEASDPDRWQFPVGTRFWKEFAFGRRVETRYMERRGDGSWAYATYVWDAAGSDAELAPERGLKRAFSLASGVGYDIPSRIDCSACHEGRPGGVLGFNALQLSPDPDPLAVHREPPLPGAVDLAELERRGAVQGLPAVLLAAPPRIAARSATERAALGYLYGNCSSCHNAAGPLAPLGLDFDQSVGASASLSRAGVTSVGQPSRFLLPGAEHSLRIAPGRPEASTLSFRMGSRGPTTQMPPFGTRLVDEAGLALIERWITEDLSDPLIKESTSP